MCSRLASAAEFLDKSSSGLLKIAATEAAPSQNLPDTPDIRENSHVQGNAAKEMLDNYVLLGVHGHTSALVKKQLNV